MKTLYVRINPAQKSVQKFFSCGVEFSREWKKLAGADPATARRLAAEQMLEVTETRPAELDETPAGDSAETLVPPVDMSVPPAAASEAVAEVAAPEAVAEVAAPEAVAEVAAPNKKSVK